MESIDHIWLVLSGKGGVGKSSTTAQIGLTLAAQGFRVGILDVDLTGPSMPRVLGLESSTVRQSSAGWVPVYTDESQSLGVMSIGFLVKDRGEGIVWRGPKKTAMIRQFMKDVAWGHLDYLLVDTPPGTSDEHISLAEELQAYSPDGAILVTTPQEVAAADVRKELSFCKKVNFKILGVIENLSGYICPHCSECTHIFSKGGGKKLAEQYSVPFLGSVPMDSGFIKMVEDQEVTKVYSSCALSKIFDGIVKSVIQAESTGGSS